MSLKVCPACGAEYIAIIAKCADCGVQLVDPAGADAAPGPTRTVRPRDADDEVEFDLAEWTADERALLDGALLEAGVAHRWEGGGGQPATVLPHEQVAWQMHALLVVRVEDADTVDDLLDTIEFPDALEPAAPGDDDVDDEAAYAVMSDLYLAADKLKNNPADVIALDDFVNAAETAAGSPIPYGVEIRMWEQVQGSATALAEEIDGDALDEDIARDAATIRNLLARYV